MFIQLTLSAVVYSLKDSIVSNMFLLTAHLQYKEVRLKLWCQSTEILLCVKHQKKNIHYI